MTAQKKWTVLELLNTTSEYFKNRTIENPRLNAELLLGKALNLSRVQLYVSFERPLQPAEVNEYRQLVRRRSGHEPLQYILGETEFMGLPFKVSPAALIPRPETEILVEEVLKLKGVLTGNPVHILDLGTGSGCIPVSLAQHWPEARLTGTDISEEALRLAAENAGLNHVTDRINWIHHDMRQPFNEGMFEKIDILISNPPYISSGEMTTLSDEVRLFEPETALTDRMDGLTFYRRLFEISRELNTIQYAFFEMSGSQTQRILGMAEEIFPGKVSAVNDLTHIPRVLKIEVSNE